MRLEHHLVGGYVRYISPYIIIIIIPIGEDCEFVAVFLIILKRKDCCTRHNHHTNVFSVVVPLLPLTDRSADDVILRTSINLNLLL